jgi:hypothetical protein
MFDLSANGSLADEATLITALAGALTAIGGLIFAWRRAAKLSEAHDQKLTTVVETLNNVDGTPTSEGNPSLGYRVVRIENQVTEIKQNLQDLTLLMTEHIQWETKKQDKIMHRLENVEDTLMEIERRSNSQAD